MTIHPKNIKTSNVGIIICFAMTIATTSLASETKHLHSEYAGQQTRSIKSLSKDDIAQLSAGKGWGLAKAAELNGVPGPAHLLEMKEEIALSESQVEKIQQLFDDMQQQAQTLGKKLIRLESELNQAFANRTVDKKSLREKLSSIADVRKELRYVHLATHLETPSILSEKQISKYNALRGYSGDPCANIPKGHNKEMWLKHNGCK